MNIVSKNTLQNTMLVCNRLFSTNQKTLTKISYQIPDLYEKCAANKYSTNILQNHVDRLNMKMTYLETKILRLEQKYNGTKFTNIKTNGSQPFPPPHKRPGLEF